MAEYIEREALIKELQEEIEFDSPMHNEVENDWLTRGLKIALKDVKRFPTADVVPKSEVEKLKADVEVWKQNRFNLFQRLECYEMARQKVASEIFEEIEQSIAVHAFTSKSEDYADGIYDAIEWVDSKIAELKKKYTEDKE